MLLMPLTRLSMVAEGFENVSCTQKKLQKCVSK